MNHPAKYNDAFLEVFSAMLKGRKRIIDPFAGTGKIFKINTDADIVGVEIEPEWAALHPKTIVGNALRLPFASRSFDAACTSPTYGNRMADTLLDEYKRITYTSALGRKLNPQNSGGMQWGQRYRRFHVEAWKELYRVLSSDAVFVLNIKNHIRKREEQFVTEWHVSTLVEIGFSVQDWQKIPVSSMGFGENRELRVPFESIIKFRK